VTRSETQKKGVHPRCDEKSAEVIDKQRVVRRPSRIRVRNPLKRKDLNAKKAELERAQVENFRIGEWHFEAQCEQTRERIA
jgi:hypothetical protein